MTRLLAGFIAILSFIQFACVRVRIQPLTPRSMILVTMPTPNASGEEESSSPTLEISIPFPAKELSPPRQDLAHTYPELFRWLDPPQPRLRIPGVPTWDCLYYIRGDLRGSPDYFEKLAEAEYRGLGAAPIDLICEAPFVLPALNFDAFEESTLSSS